MVRKQTAAALIRIIAPHGVRRIALCRSTNGQPPGSRPAESPRPPAQTVTDTARPKCPFPMDLRPRKKHPSVFLQRFLQPVVQPVQVFLISMDGNVRGA